MDEFIEREGAWGTGIAALAGVLITECLYCTSAEAVGLLWLILLIPVGAVAGAASFWIVIWCCCAALVLGALAVTIGAVILVTAAIGGLIVGLYNLVVWSN